MKYKVKALSDLIFIASSNTQGNIRYLDFIPGSAFLGVIAKHYDLFENPFDVFFSGKVRFKDAHIAINSKPSLKIPLMYYHEKLNKQKIYNYWKLEPADFKGIQYKQIREGYFNGKNFMNVEFSYTQKSAREKEKGRSKEGAMFGFRSIVKGSEFYFEIAIDESIGERDRKLIKELIIGEHYVGKSKKSEYGTVEISECDYDDTVNSVKKSDKYDFVYFKSRACLFDENGNPTYDVRYLHKNLKPENIVYEKNQIRNYEYVPYNFKRKEDLQRCVIEKGSVAVLKNVPAEILEDMKKGVGGFLSEGFGEVIVNPEFLFDKKIELNEVKLKLDFNSEYENDFIQYLKVKKQNIIKETKMIKDVKKIVEDKAKWFSNITKSQWGNIRTLAVFDDYDTKIKNYISKGINQWLPSQQQIMDEILKKEKEFVKLFATLIMKKAKK